MPAVPARRCRNGSDGLNPRFPLIPSRRVSVADVRESSEKAAKRLAAEPCFMLPRVARRVSFGTLGAEDGEERPIYPNEDQWYNSRT